MHLLQANVNLIYIRDLLGHVDIATTEIYARADIEMKRKVLEAAYVDLHTEEMPNWSKDQDLMEWLKNLCD
jgi:site-specific recombinase XerD